MRFPLISSVEEFGKHFRAEFWRDAAISVCGKHGIYYDLLARSDHGENIVFLVDDKFVIKIYTPYRRGFAREKAALEFAGGRTSLKLPEIVYAGGIEGFDYLVMTQLEGKSLTRDEWLKLEARQQMSIVSELGAGLKELHSHGAESLDFDWSAFIENQANTCFERQKAAGTSPQWLESLPQYLAENLKLLPTDFTPVFLHGDVHFGNLRLAQKAGKRQISGLFDLADSLAGFHEYEFVAPGVLMIQGQGELQREFFRAYGYKESELDCTLRRRLMLLAILYECSDLRKYALRLKPEAVNFTLEELEKAIWNFR
jgi:aminoglycoside phosphotransferase